MAQESNLQWLFLDLETTGLNPETHQIIEVAAIRRTLSGGAREYQTLVNPGVSIDPFIQRLTGISDEMTQTAPILSDIQPELEDLLEGVFLVAHQASFDVSFLEAGLGIRIERKYVIDTIELTKVLFPQLSSYSLRSLVRHFQLPVEPCHRAMADTQALQQLFYFLVSYAQSLPQSMLVNLAALLQDQNQGLSVLFERLVLNQPVLWDASEAGFFSVPPSQVEFVRQQRESEAWQLAGWGGSAPVDGENKKIVWQPQAIAALLETGGLVEAAMQDEYQSRPGQLAMLQVVAKALEQSRCLMVEAGTGVGKSLAYLIPALYWAVSHEEKVVVATHTIALQEQLFNKEIEFLHKVLPFHFQCALLKGRSNYLCLSRWEQVREQGKDLVWGEKILLARLYMWLQSSLTGDLDSIHLLGPEREWFAQMASSRDTCQGTQCVHYRDCFYQRARQRAQAADLVIVNHALLLADAKLGEAVLPKYSYLIVDEAHHLEEEGTRQFTLEFSLAEYEKNIQLLHKRRDVFGRPGLLQYLKEWKKQGLGTIQRLDEVLDELAGAVKQTLLRIKKLQHYLQLGSAPETLRIHSGTVNQVWWQNVQQLLDNLLFVSGDLRKAVKSMEDLLLSDESRIFDEAWVKGQLQHIVSVKEAIMVFAQFMEGVARYNSGQFDNDEIGMAFEQADEGCQEQDSCQQQDDACQEQIYWLKSNSRFNDLTLCLTPINTAQCFKQYLFENKEAVILTSATLSVNHSFEYLRQQLGIDPDWLDTKILPSPFNYEEQVLLMSDSALPDPANTSELVYNLALKESLSQILEACGGRTLVLFTSHRQLRIMYEEMTGFLTDRGLELFADGINGNRNSLLEELRSNEQAIVFGANTFWEGIDLPGLALTSLVIIRLPFTPPGQPLMEARTEHLRKSGQDPFYKYSLPQAVLRFKQGYGRLIRSNKDWGVVVVLDNRIIHKRYGRVFLKSLPEERCISDKAEHLAKQIKDWQSRFLTSW
jgi:ATP-dependent DNA helicase DinG